MGGKFHLNGLLITLIALSGLLFFAGKVYRHKLAGNHLSGPSPEMPASGSANTGLSATNGKQPRQRGSQSDEEAQGVVASSGSSKGASAPSVQASVPASSSRLGLPRNSPSQSASSDEDSTDKLLQRRRQQPVATGLPGENSRADTAQSARYWNAGFGGGTTVNEEGAVVVIGAPESTLSGSGDASGSTIAENGASDQSDTGSDGEEEPEKVVTPLDVVQIARTWEAGVLQVSYAVIVDEDDTTATPNGVIVSQQIPEGWELVDAEPRIEAVDYGNRIVKWLFVGDAVQNGAIYSLAMKASDEQDGNWNETQAWYTFRNPDGQCVDVSVIPYSESDIQPTP